jgi:hypothetical protein
VWLNDPILNAKKVLFFPIEECEFPKVIHVSQHSKLLSEMVMTMHTTVFIPDSDCSAISANVLRKVHKRVT